MKKNLAKMLGMEEMQQPTVAEPSYEQQADTKIQEIGQVFDQTQYATDVALESIASATQLMNVVADNNSTDKVAYSVLKTAVEQLKERTGVYTSSVALEDLSPLNYKSEGIEDIKKFVAKVWEAIKKALSFVKEKVKEFFAWMFKAKTDVVKQAEEAQKKADELEKELHKAPKNENEAKNYKSDYFVKPAALGYTDGTDNKTFVKGSGFDTNDKQPEYSGNFVQRNVYSDAKPHEFSKQVTDVLGYRESKKESIDNVSFKKNFTELNRNIRDLAYIISNSSNFKYMSPTGDEINDSDLTLPNSVNKKIYTEIGNTSFTFKANDARTAYEFIIEQDGGKDLVLWDVGFDALHECLLGNNGCIDFLKNLSDTIVPDLEENLNVIQKEIEHAEKRIEKLTDETKISNIKKYQQYCNFEIGVTKSTIACIGKLTKYVIILSKALIQAINDRVNYYKHMGAKMLKERGFISTLREFEQTYLDGKSW